jgi:hypothetical protein
MGEKEIHQGFVINEKNFLCIGFDILLYRNCTQKNINFTLPTQKSAVNLHHISLQLW